MRKQPVPEGAEASRSVVDVELDRIKAEIDAWIDDHIPEPEREDFKVQMALFLETHPAMAQRIEALRSLVRAESGVVGEEGAAGEGADRKLG